MNGFHDIANPVATSLPAGFTVVVSGPFNRAGVLASSGGVALGIVSLLLIPQAGTRAIRLAASGSNSRDERPAPWALRSRRERTAEWRTDWER
jgi:hypothetical protein